MLPPPREKKKEWVPRQTDRLRRRNIIRTPLPLPPTPTPPPKKNIVESGSNAKEIWDKHLYRVLSWVGFDFTFTLNFSLIKLGGWWTPPYFAPGGHSIWKWRGCTYQCMNSWGYPWQCSCKKGVIGWQIRKMGIIGYEIAQNPGNFNNF